MTDRRTFILHNPQQAKQAVDTAWKHAKGWLMAGGASLMMEIGPCPKSREQEEKYHAIIGEIAKQAQHLGSVWAADDWKRLLLDKFARETGRTHGRVIPNLDQSGVVEVGIQSRKFSVKAGAEFIEWLHAWCVENGVELSQ